MKIGKDVYIGLLAIFGTVFICYAYKTNDDHFWRYFDTGFMSIIISWILLAGSRFILSFIGWVMLAYSLNSWITSMFFDVTIYGESQKIFGWGCAIVFSIIGISHAGIKHYWKIQRQREDLKCKKAARNKYKDMLKRISHIEDQLGAKIESLDYFIKQLLTDE